MKDKKYSFYQKKQRNQEEFFEYDYLIKKKQVYAEKIGKQEECLEKMAKIIAENEKKIKCTEKEYKDLMEKAGDYYLKTESARILLEKKNKKAKISDLMDKKGNSKINSLIFKEKSLRTELKTLKEKELEISSKISNASKAVNIYQEKISITPIVFSNKSLTENRSFSVRIKEKTRNRLNKYDFFN